MADNDDKEKTQIIPSVPPDASKVPLPSSRSQSDAETQIISPIKNVGDDAPTSVGMKPIKYGKDEQETSTLPPARPSSEKLDLGETTMYMGSIPDFDDEGEEAPATPEDFGYADYGSDSPYEDFRTGTYDFSQSFPQPPSAPAAPPQIPVYGSQETYAAEPKRKRGGKGWIVFTIILIILAILCIAGWWWWRSDMQQKALEDCQQIQTQLNDATDNARQVIASAQSALDSAVYSQNGGSFISALHSDIDTTLPVSVSCPVSGSAALLNSNADTMTQAVNQVNALISKTKSDISALKQSQIAEALEKAKNSLRQCINSANQALAQNDGAVENPGTITQLQSELAQAESVLQDSSSTASQMQAAQTKLQEAVAKVAESAQQYEQKELDALNSLKKQEGQKSKASNSNPSSSLTGTGKDSYNRTMAGPDQGNLEGSPSPTSAQKTQRKKSTNSK